MAPLLPERRQARRGTMGRTATSIRGMTEASTLLLIDGELREAASGATFTTYDPARGQELARVAQAGADDVDAAVTAARGAFDGAWAKTSPAKRARALNRLAQLLDERTDELADL